LTPPYLYSSPFLCPFLLIRSTSISTLFPYTTLFRSLIVALTVINNELIQGLPSSIVIISLLAYVVGCSLEYYFKIHRVDKQTSRSEEHTSELQSRFDLVCRLLLEKKKYIFGICLLVD